MMGLPTNIALSLKEEKNILVPMASHEIYLDQLSMKKKDLKLFNPS